MMRQETPRVNHTANQGLKGMRMCQGSPSVVAHVPPLGGCWGERAVGRGAAAVCRRSSGCMRNLSTFPSVVLCEPKATQKKKINKALINLKIVRDIKKENIGLYSQSKRMFFIHSLREKVC